LYSDLMNTYGDNGNLRTLTYRCQQRGIKIKILNFTLNSPLWLLEQADLFLMGGAEDHQQEIAANDFDSAKIKVLAKKIAENVPGLFICGAYQFLGQYYQINNQKLAGLKLSMHYTVSVPDKPRLIGEIVTEITHPNLCKFPRFKNQNHSLLIGFENHGGRTYLNEQKNALGKVITGQGNNGQDKTEGVVINNVIGTYLHGPILPRNPALADYLIEKALEIKYNQTVALKELNDDLEEQNRQWLLNKLNVKNNKH